LGRCGISRVPPRGKYTSATAADGAILDAERFVVQATRSLHATREYTLLLRVIHECQGHLQWLESLPRMMTMKRNLLRTFSFPNSKGRMEEVRKNMFYSQKKEKKFFLSFSYLVLD
jgi:hypothetical protein